MLKSLELAFRGSIFKIFPGENTPGPPFISRTCPPTLNLFLSFCITNFIEQIIVLSGPSKPGNTDSVSQNFIKLGKHIPGLPRFRVCPSHFLERIVALASEDKKTASFIHEFMDKVLNPSKLHLKKDMGENFLSFQQYTLFLY